MIGRTLQIFNDRCIVNQSPAVTKRRKGETRKKHDNVPNGEPLEKCTIPVMDSNSSQAFADDTCTITKKNNGDEILTIAKKENDISYNFIPKITFKTVATENCSLFVDSSNCVAEKTVSDQLPGTHESNILNACDITKQSHNCNKTNKSINGITSDFTDAFDANKNENIRVLSRFDDKISNDDYQNDKSGKSYEKNNAMNYKSFIETYIDIKNNSQTPNNNFESSPGESVDLFAKNDTSHLFNNKIAETQNTVMMALKDGTKCEKNNFGKNETVRKTLRRNTDQQKYKNIKELSNKKPKLIRQPYKIYSKVFEFYDNCLNSTAYENKKSTKSSCGNSEHIPHEDRERSDLVKQRVPANSICGQDCNLTSFYPIIKELLSIKKNCGNKRMYNSKGRHVHKKDKTQSITDKLIDLLTDLDDLYLGKSKRQKNEDLTVVNSNDSKSSTVELNYKRMSAKKNECISNNGDTILNIDQNFENTAEDLENESNTFHGQRNPKVSVTVFNSEKKNVFKAETVETVCNFNGSSKPVSFDCADNSIKINPKNRSDQFLISCSDEKIRFVGEDIKRCGKKVVKTKRSILMDCSKIKIKVVRKKAKADGVGKDKRRKYKQKILISSDNSERTKYPSNICNSTQTEYHDSSDESSVSHDQSTHVPGDRNKRRRTESNESYTGVYELKNPSKCDNQTASKSITLETAASKQSRGIEQPVVCECLPKRKGKFNCECRTKSKEKKKSLCACKSKKPKNKSKPVKYPSKIGHLSCINLPSRNGSCSGAIARGSDLKNGKVIRENIPIAPIENVVKIKKEFQAILNQNLSIDKLCNAVCSLKEEDFSDFEYKSECEIPDLNACSCQEEEIMCTRARCSLEIGCLIDGNDCCSVKKPTSEKTSIDDQKRYANDCNHEFHTKFSRDNIANNYTNWPKCTFKIFKDKNESPLINDNLSCVSDAVHSKDNFMTLACPKCHGGVYKELTNSLGPISTKCGPPHEVINKSDTSDELVSAEDIPLSTSIEIGHTYTNKYDPCSQNSGKDLNKCNGIERTASDKLATSDEVEQLPTNATNASDNCDANSCRGLRTIWKRMARRRLDCYGNKLSSIAPRDDSPPQYCHERVKSCHWPSVCGKEKHKCTTNTREVYPDNEYYNSRVCRPDRVQCNSKVGNWKCCNQKKNSSKNKWRSYDRSKWLNAECHRSYPVSSQYSIRVKSAFLKGSYRRNKKEQHVSHSLYEMVKSKIRNIYKNETRRKIKSHLCSPFASELEIKCQEYDRPQRSECESNDKRNKMLLHLRNDTNIRDIKKPSVVFDCTYLKREGKSHDKHHKSRNKGAEKSTSSNRIGNDKSNIDKLEEVQSETNDTLIATYNKSHIHKKYHKSTSTQKGLGNSDVNFKSLNGKNRETTISARKKKKHRFQDQSLFIVEVERNQIKHTQAHFSKRKTHGNNDYEKHLKSLKSYLSPIDLIFILTGEQLLEYFPFLSKEEKIFWVRKASLLNNSEKRNHFFKILNDRITEISTNDKLEQSLSKFVMTLTGNIMSSEDWQRMHNVSNTKQVNSNKLARKVVLNQINMKRNAISLSKRNVNKKTKCNGFRRDFSKHAKIDNLDLSKIHNDKRSITYRPTCKHAHRHSRVGAKRNQPKGHRKGDLYYKSIACKVGSFGSVNGRRIKRHFIPMPFKITHEHKRNSIWEHDCPIHSITSVGKNNANASDFNGSCDLIEKSASKAFERGKKCKIEKTYSSDIFAYCCGESRESNVESSDNNIITTKCTAVCNKRKSTGELSIKTLLKPLVRAVKQKYLKACETQFLPPSFPLLAASFPGIIPLVKQMQSSGSSVRVASRSDDCLASCSKDDVAIKRQSRRYSGSSLESSKSLESSNPSPPPRRTPKDNAAQKDAVRSTSCTAPCSGNESKNCCQTQRASQRLPNLGAVRTASVASSSSSTCTETSSSPACSDPPGSFDKPNRSTLARNNLDSKGNYPRRADIESQPKDAYTNTQSQNNRPDKKTIEGQVKYNIKHASDSSISHHIAKTKLRCIESVSKDSSRNDHCSYVRERLNARASGVDSNDCSPGDKYYFGNYPRLKAMQSNSHKPHEDCLTRSIKGTRLGIGTATPQCSGENRHTKQIVIRIGPPKSGTTGTPFASSSDKNVSWEENGSTPSGSISSCVTPKPCCASDTSSSPLPYGCYSNNSTYLRSVPRQRIASISNDCLKQYLHEYFKHTLSDYSHLASMFSSTDESLVSDGRACVAGVVHFGSDVNVSFLNDRYQSNSPYQSSSQLYGDDKNVKRRSHKQKINNKSEIQANETKHARRAGGNERDIARWHAGHSEDDAADSAQSDPSTRRAGAPFSGSPRGGDKLRRGYYKREDIIVIYPKNSKESNRSTINTEKRAKRKSRKTRGYTELCLCPASEKFPRYRSRHMHNNMKLFQKSQSRKIKTEKSLRTTPIPSRHEGSNTPSIEDETGDEITAEETPRLQGSDSALSSRCLREFYQAENILTEGSTTSGYAKSHGEDENARSTGRVRHSKDDTLQLPRKPSSKMTPTPYEHNKDEEDAEMNTLIPSYNEFKRRMKAIKIKDKIAKKAEVRRAKEAKATKSIGKLRNAIFGTDSSCQMNIENRVTHHSYKNPHGSSKYKSRSRKNTKTHNEPHQGMNQADDDQDTRVERYPKVDSKKSFKLGHIKRTRSKLSILNLRNKVSSIIVRSSPIEKSFTKSKLKRLSKIMKYDESVVLKVTAGTPIETQTSFQCLPMPECLSRNSNNSIMKRHNGPVDQKPMNLNPDDPRSEVKSLPPLTTNQVQEQDSSPDPRKSSPYGLTSEENNGVKSNPNYGCDINLEQWELIDPIDKSLGYKKKINHLKQPVRFLPDSHLENLVTDEDITNRIRRNIRGQWDDSCDVSHMPKTPPLFIPTSSRKCPSPSNPNNSTASTYNAEPAGHVTTNPGDMFDCSTDDDDFTLSTISGAAMFLKKPKIRAIPSNTLNSIGSRQLPELRNLYVRSGDMRMPEIKHVPRMTDVRTYDLRKPDVRMPDVTRVPDSVRVCDIRMPDVSRIADSIKTNIRLTDSRNETQKRGLETWPSEGRSWEHDPNPPGFSLGSKITSKRSKDRYKDYNTKAITRNDAPGSVKCPPDNVTPSCQTSGKYWPNRYVDGHTLVFNGNIPANIPKDSRKLFNKREINSKVKSKNSANLVDVCGKLTKACGKSKNLRKCEGGTAKSSFRLCFTTKATCKGNGFILNHETLHTSTAEDSPSDKSSGSKMPKKYDIDGTLYSDFCS